MTTTTELKLCKGLPYQIRARANGKYDYVADNQTYSQDTSVSLSMTTYNGLSEQYTQGYQTADITDFGLTALPWGYEYNSTLSTSRFCLMPIKHSYLNVVPTVDVRDFSTNGSVTIDDTTKIATVSGDANLLDYVYKAYGSALSTPSSSLEICTKFKSTTQNDIVGGKAKFFGTSVTDSSAPLILTASWNGMTIRTLNANNTTIISQSDWSFDTWYWVKVIITTSSCTAYWSLDGSNWNGPINVTGVPALATCANNPRWSLGRMNYTVSSLYDLGETYIKADDSVYWWNPYTSGAGTSETLPGVTYNFVDDGSAVTLNCFTENFDDAVVLTPNVSYGSHEMTNPLNGSIYTSMVYTEIAMTDDWEDEDNLVDWDLEDEVDNMIIGSPTISTNTISGFSTSNYLMQTSSFNPGNHWWTVYGTFGITSTGVQQIFAQSDGFVLGIDENNNFFAKLYDADGEIGTITITDYTATTGTWMDATIHFEEIDGQYIYGLFAMEHFTEPSYAELQSNRTILSGPITFGCGYNQVPQRLLGTVSIPSHTAYDYSNGTWTVK